MCAAEARMKRNVFLVDDDPKILQAAREALESVGLKVTCFTCARDCLEKIVGKKCDLLVTDVRMPGINGMELLAEVRHSAPWLPVLILTAYGDIPMAARAFKNGALDFIEKPFSRETLISAVEDTLRKTGPVDTLLGKSLSKTEMRVLPLLLDGKGNKETALLLNRSVRTIENHRSHIMRKLGADNLIDLFKRAAAMGLVELSPSR
jgi:two-component system response regulator FixJ